MLTEAVRRLRSIRRDVRVSVTGLDDGEEEATAPADVRVDALLTWTLPEPYTFAREELVEEWTSALLAQGHRWAHRPRVPLTVLAAECLYGQCARTASRGLSVSGDHPHGRHDARYCNSLRRLVTARLRWPARMPGSKSLRLLQGTLHLAC
ncbi:hypothetical protein ACIBQ5_36590 [Streptomyces massasporeus]|uniref:hypothetical protein n=1 Tax=Streptomyces massasporeus TaxID=67324 RepID=UPI0037B67ADD